MNRIRSASIIVAGLALGAAVSAFAGVSGQVIQQIQDRANSSSSSSASAPSSSSAPASDPGPQYSSPPQSAPAAARAAEARSQAQNRNNQQTRGTSSARTDNAQASRGGTPQDSRDSEQARNQRGVVGGSLSRNYRNREPGNGNGNGSGHDHDNHRPPPRVVYTLPPVYSNYYWDGYPYYAFDGGWYRPYGSSYVSVDAPYGLFVATLPGYSTSFTYGNDRYYYYDDTYYTYDQTRRGYVVARSPYRDGDDEYYGDDAQKDSQKDADLYVYPAQNQSEQQQADDRYACHKWAVKEAGYDPIDDAYDRSKRASYTRAITACLNGRGYSVR